MTAIRSSLLAFTGALALLTAPTIARADGRAWAAIQKRLPADVYAVGGVNLAAVRGAKLWKSLPALIAEDREASEVTKLVKKHCKLDPYAAIDDAVLAMANAPGGDDVGVVVVALKGVDQTAFDGCLRKAAKAEEKVTITTTQVGAVTEYGAVGENDKLYIAWLAKDVMAIGTEPDDKAVLDRFLAGKGVGPALTAVIGKTNVAGTVWGAMAQDTPLDGMTLKTVHGAVAFARGKFVVEAHLGMATAAEASTMAAGAKHELDGMTARAPKNLQAMLKAITITAIGGDLAIGTSVVDQKSTDLMKMLDKVF